MTSFQGGSNHAILPFVHFGGPDGRDQYQNAGQIYGRVTPWFFDLAIDLVEFLL